MKNFKAVIMLPKFYYNAGLFYLAWCVISFLFPVLNSKYFFSLGIIVFTIGLLIDLGKKRFENIDSDFELSIIKIKNSYLRNALRNLYVLYVNCFDKGTYLCRFYMKTGTLLTVFVDTKKEAEDYKEWYKSDMDLDDKTFDLYDNKCTRLFKTDIETYDYIKITNIQKNIIDPVQAFFKQNCIFNLSVGRIIGFCLFYVITVIGYSFINTKYSFIEDGSLITYETYENIIRICLFSTQFIIIAGTLIVISGLLTYKKTMENYYAKTFSRELSVGNNLLKIILILILWSGFILQPVTKFLYYISAQFFVV